MPRLRARVFPDQDLMPISLLQPKSRRVSRPLSRLGHKARSFLRLPWFTQAWFIPMWVLLGISKASIFTVPFRTLAPRLGHKSSIHPRLPVLTPEQEHRARRIGEVVRLTARYTPWNSNCFPQAISARVLLGLYHVPYMFYFGLAPARDGVEKMNAHAWVVAGRVAVTGGRSFGQFTVVGCFESPEFADPTAT